MKTLVKGGAAAAALLGVMFGGSILLWVGVPLGWLYVGSQVQGASGSVGTALLVMLVGAPLTVLLVAKGLAWLNNRYEQVRTELNRPPRRSALEVVLTLSAIVAVTGFVFWFLVLAGPGPAWRPRTDPAHH